MSCICFNYLNCNDILNILAAVYHLIIKMHVFSSLYRNIANVNWLKDTQCRADNFKAKVITVTTP